MPRVANPPAQGRGASRHAVATPHKQSLKIPLNDDRGEKAARLQSRQALQELQMNQIKAAVTPMRQLKNYDRASSSSPRTPKGGSGQDTGKENNHDGGISVVQGSAVTPMKRVPILANFEEWMKMATDNKINATNSWHFALIDYFHDMSLLKEGDGVNFQKASCTLDGCVKIYTSRVDSVATETGKLLSGLADSGNRKQKEREEGEQGEDGEDEEDGEGEDGEKKKTRKKTQRSHEATLAPSFASLQLKKLELEFAVDPLFKKASADFDEGGAKGLLLNHLAIDNNGRIVFDSSDDAGDATASDVAGIDNTTKMEETEHSGAEETAAPREMSTAEGDSDIDLAPLAAKFFPDLSQLDEQDVCPSLKSFSLGDSSSNLEIPFLKAPEDWRQQDKPPEAILSGAAAANSENFLNGGSAAGFDDDDDGALGGFDIPSNAGFGEGGEAWAKEAALEPMLLHSRMDQDGQSMQDNQDGVAVGDFDPANPSEPYAVSLNHSVARPGDEHENILSYFDNALKSNKGWAGPEHWRIRRIKDASTSANTPPARQRKEKEPFEIDFLSPMSETLAEMIYTPAASNSAISLPKAQWKTKGRNLLPDDKHFSSRSLLTLFLKPKARLGSRRPVSGLPPRGGTTTNTTDQNDNIDDPAYWAAQKADLASDEVEPPKGDYDANFFADDDGLPFSGGLPDIDDDDDAMPFADAREAFTPPPTDPASAAVAAQQNLDGILASSQDPSAPQNPDQQIQPNAFLPGSFGSQLVTGANNGARRVRPEYVNYARTAKKVDVRKLKENLWSGMSQNLIAAMDSRPVSRDSRIGPEAPPTPAPTEPDLDQEGEGKKEEIVEEKNPEEGKGELKFTELMGDLRKVYPETQMKDISTSYCFICLLHLANEKGLVLRGKKAPIAGSGDVGVGADLSEIWVRKDEACGEDYEGE
ncbi:MAG: hypothetical protein Q9227_006020 [Pyrenula ochraceoflavens]